MQIAIKKWGNSAALRLPQTLLAQFNLEEGDHFDVDIQANALTLRPVKAARPKYSLETLLAEMPEGYPIIKEWEMLETVGKEG